MPIESNSTIFVNDLDGPLREAVEKICASDVPTDRMNTCLDRVSCSLSSELEGNKPTVESSERAASIWRTKNRRRWIVGLATVAAMTLMITLHFCSPSVSLAQVIHAVSRMTWVHVTVNSSVGDAKVHLEEAWYSPNHEMSATRHKEWIRFDDHKLRIYYAYDSAEGVLYRVPDVETGRQSHLANIMNALPRLLAKGKPPEDPLSNLEFLGSLRDDLTVVNQRTQQISSAGREWLDYTLTLKIRGREEPVNALFRVDPTSKLPQLAQISGQQNGQAFLTEAMFDYPETGPEDVFALGVPPDAKLVDRVPTDDLARLISGVAVGRLRFDDFRAVVVHSVEKGDWWRNRSIEIVHRKGNRMRRDMGFLGDDPAEPAADVDRADWWGKRAEVAQYNLASIAIAGVERMFDVRTINQPDGSQRREAVSRQPFGSELDAEQWIPSFYTLTPDYAGRPPLGVPSQRLEAIIEPDPGDGPAGTVLLRVITSRRSDSASNPEANKERAKPGGWRFWIDPAREFVVMRWDMQGSSHIVESLAQSPSGRWYPTRVRRTSSDPAVEDDITEFYVDFDVDIPDTLFDVKKPRSVEELFRQSAKTADDEDRK